MVNLELEDTENTTVSSSTMMDQWRTSPSSHLVQNIILSNVDHASVVKEEKLYLEIIT